MSCQMAVSKSWDLFHIDLKPAFLRGQSNDVNRDVVCQLPPEAGHQPNCCKTEETCMWHERCHPDAGGTFSTMHCVALAWFPHESIDAVTYCILCSRVSKLGNTEFKGPSHSRTAQKTPSPTHVSNQKWKLHLKKKNAGSHSKKPKLQENPWQESSIYLWMIFWNRWKRNGTTCSGQT